MIEFKRIEDESLVLRHAILVRSVHKLMIYCKEHDGVELTVNKYFKRKFVEWAVVEFDWPYYTADDLYAINKVLNEIDFPPLGFIHELLIHLKMGRHYKGKFKLTKNGQSLVDDPCRLFGILTPYFLFEYDSWSMSPARIPPLGNWEVFLNVLNVEVVNPITGLELCRHLYGPQKGEDGAPSPHLISSFYITVLRPLCWAGLLKEIKAANNNWSIDRLFMKTPLWGAALGLDTDHMLR